MILFTMTEIFDFFLNLQDHLNDFTRQYGVLVYALLFLIVFCETGLVVTPFLPMAVQIIRVAPNNL